MQKYFGELKVFAIFVFRTLGEALHLMDLCGGRLIHLEFIPDGRPIDANLYSEQLERM